MYLLLFELPMNRTGVWFSGHMAGKAGFFLGVPLSGPFFVGGVNGGVGGVVAGGGGDALVSGAPLVGVPALEVSVFGGSDGVGIPSAVGVGSVVLP